MKKCSFFIFLLFTCVSLYSQSQSYRYLKIVIDTAQNFQPRELEWFDGGISYPEPAMTAYNAPVPLLLSGDTPNYAIHRLYDDNLAVDIYVGNVLLNPEFTYELTLDLGSGNGILPDSIRMTKPAWTNISAFRILLSEDASNWDLYLDTTLIFWNFDIQSFPLAYVEDISPPTTPENLHASLVTSSQITLDWEVSDDNFLVTQYHIFQDGNLIDSTSLIRLAIKDLADTTDFEFHVVALDKARNQSPSSDTIQITTLSIDNSPPVLTSGIAFQSIEENIVTISWSPAEENRGLSGYLISLDGVFIGVTEATTFSLCGLKRSTDYSVSIIAKDFSGNRSGSITADFTTIEGCPEMKIGTNFWNQHWSIESNQLFINGFQNVVGPNPWKQDLLDELDYAETLRFMEMQQINREPSYTWLERRTKNNILQDEIAFEWMIDLCNRKNANLWVCIPVHVVDRNGIQRGRENYIKKLAILIKTGVDMGDIDLDQPEFTNLEQFTAYDFILNGGTAVCEPLASNLKVYIEYGNENWNFVFPQTYYCIDEGEAMDLNPSLVSTGRLFSAYASVFVFEEFESVFGEEAARVEKILPIQTSDRYHSYISLRDIFDNDTLNPSGIMPDIFSGATYIGNNLDGADPNIEQLLYDAIDDRLAAFTEYRATLDDLGEQRDRYFRMIAYEGGSHVDDNYEMLNNSSLIYDVYARYLDSMSLLFEEMVLFSHVATNAFGLKQYVGQPTSEAHKYRGVVDWLDAHSCLSEYSCTSDTLLLSGILLTNKNYETDGGIESTEIITGVDSANYDAEDYILLKPGFSVANGVTFHAYIDGCSVAAFSETEVSDDKIDTTLEEITFTKNNTTSSGSNLNQKLSLSIFPNPFQNQFEIFYKIEQSANFSLTIYNAVGAVVSQPLIAKWQEKGEYSYRIDASLYQKGLYVVVLNGGNQLYTKKVVTN